MKKTLCLLLLATACASPASKRGPDTVPLTDLSSAPGVASWSAWPQAGHDGRRSGAATVKGPQTGHLRWTRKLEGNVTPGPVVAPDGTIVVATNRGVLHGIDPATGADRWTYDGGGGYGIDLSTSAAVLPDGTILWPGPHNALYGLSSKGKELWREVLPGQPSSPAVSADGSQAVVGSSDGTVKAFDVTHGGHALLWSVTKSGDSYGSVALSPSDPKRAYQTEGDQLFAIEDGVIVWSKSLGAVTEVSPAVAPDGTVVVGNNGKDELAFHPDGTLAWTYRRGFQTYSSPVVTADGTAWFGDHGAYVTGVDARTGALRARFRGEAVEPKGGPSVGVWTSPLVDAAHDVYWGTRLGHVYGRSPAGAVLFDLSTHATVDSYPALTSDGLLVVGVTDGTLLGIGS